MLVNINLELVDGVEDSDWIKERLQFEYADQVEPHLLDVCIDFYIKHICDNLFTLVKKNDDYILFVNIQEVEGKLVDKLEYLSSWIPSYIDEKFHTKHNIEKTYQLCNVDDAIKSVKGVKAFKDQIDRVYTALIRYLHNLFEENSVEFGICLS